MFCFFCLFVLKIICFGREKEILYISCYVYGAVTGTQVTEMKLVLRFYFQRENKVHCPPHVIISPFR